MTRITRLLIANRGEIARRITRTAREMGIAVVAVYAEPDRDAPFVREADEAVALGGTTSAETYLSIEKILDAAKRSGADAVHPGYGFLSENAAFAQAVIDAGLTWVGPSPVAIAAMGDKLAAKARLAAAAVPMLPSIEIVDMSPVTLAAAGEQIGFPVLVKASAGGGGRGMRIVRDPSQLANAVASARREAASAFGNDTVFLERYIDVSRHIEIQVLGDTHGTVIHCFERECSIQRRHQKVVEEAPSSAVDPDLRRRMGEAAVSAAAAIGYTNAGTVEFLLDTRGAFFFLEMNTRLQVEHPVTESITGLDLVREQIRIAEGEPISVRQEDLSISGHAIEVRLYAEDPAKNFLPAPGTVLAWHPAVEPAIRFDSGIESGSAVPVHFDPMLAKVIAHAPTREEAALRLALALERTRIHGLTTNRDFLVATLRHEAFLAGDTTTAFIDTHQPASERTPSAEIVQAAMLAAALSGQQSSGASPWVRGPDAPQQFRFRHRTEEFALQCARNADGGVNWSIGEHSGVARVLHTDGETLGLEVDDLRHNLTVFRAGDRIWVQDNRGEVQLTELPRFPVAEAKAISGGYRAAMPGKVIVVAVSPGESVKRGQLLLVLEAMKMEHRVVADDDGVIGAVSVVVGQQVDANQVMVVVDGGTK